jgi:hypothetical protein
VPEYWSWRIACVLFLCCNLGACATRHVDLAQLDYAIPEQPPAKPHSAVQKAPQPKGPPSLAIKQRVITEDEIDRLTQKDPKLTLYVCQDILARINKKDRLYISEDIKQKRPLMVPVDFAAYLNWSPLPKTLPGGGGIPKLILVAKDIPFTGWYEHGKMKGDSLTCVGKQWGWTESGVYKVLDKAEDKYSNLYKNAYGEPAWMPYALRIYGAVWVHAGDVVGPYCSHGCINLSPQQAQKLYNWANIDDQVVIVDALGDLNRVLSTLYHPPAKEHFFYGPSTE